MSGKSAIRWTQSTWNATVGCTRVSAGCDHCYAFSLHDRRYADNLRAAHNWDPQAKRTPELIARARAAGVRLPWYAQYDLPYSQVQLMPQRLEWPLKQKKPQRIFVDSMADLHHEEIPDDYLDRIYDVMERADWHVFQILTKRPDRMAAYSRARYGDALAPAHIWLGTSVEDARVLERVDQLRSAAARVRFLSCEPLLGSLADIDLTGIHWVIAGGESGRHLKGPEDPRWMRMDWARELRDACLRYDVAFFMKQDSGPRTELRPWLVEKDESRWRWEQYPDDRREPQEVA